MTFSDENDSRFQMKQGYVFRQFLMIRGDCGDSVVKVLLKIGRSLARSQLVSLEFLIDINSFGCTMSVGSTQPLTEISTRSISWCKGGLCVRLTTLPLYT